MTAPNDGTIRTSFDRSDLNTLADLFHKIGIGSLFAGQLPQVRRNIDPDALGTDPHNLATLDAIVLPAHAKASAVLRATVRAGGVTGELTPVAYGATPITTQIAVSPCGDIVVLGTDAITDMDVVYVPERGDVIDTVFPVATNVITLPASITTRGVVLLAEVEALEGTATGDKIVLVPGAGAPAAGQARLDLAKATVTFAAADAVTRARVKLVVTAAEDLAAILEASATVL
jgi:hypothetical protein